MHMKSKTMDDSRQAATQCSLTITRSDYTRYYGLNFISRCVLYLISFLPLRFSLRFFRTPVLNGGFRWARFQDRFKFGNIDAAVVLDPKARLVAVYTDLNCTTETPPVHVIKIIRERLDLLPQPALPGDRFAAASIYQGDANSEKKGRWVNFFPVVIDCVVRDIHQCEFARARVLDADWKALEIGLSQLPREDKEKRGLYEINLSPEL